MANSNVKWRNQIGLQLGTIRPALANRETFTTALAELSDLGIREVETTFNHYDFSGFSPTEFRGLLDRFKLTMPSTHAMAREGPGLEKTLEGFQTMGLKYARIGAAGVAGVVGNLRGAEPVEPGAGGKAGAGGHASKGENTAPTSSDAIKRFAEQNNRRGKILKKFGMKNYIHNHTVEFEPVAGGKLTRHEVMVSEIDPECVTMQLDIGWAAVAGQDIVALFKKHPGRYELWHVKDATGLKTMDPMLTPTQRHRVATLCPVGEGDIDYRSIFAGAALDGLKHFAIEQDNAPQSGNPMQAVRTSYHNLMTKILV